MTFDNYLNCFGPNKQNNSPVRPGYYLRQKGTVVRGSDLADAEEKARKQKLEEPLVWGPPEDCADVTKQVHRLSGYFAPPARRQTLPEDAATRNEYPMAEGLLYYFPAALAEVARTSKVGNDQHNPGQPMHHDRSKSTAHADKIIRHLADAGTTDNDGVRHSAKVAWRALALLQEELEREEGAPLPRNAKGESV